MKIGILGSGLIVPLFIDAARKNKIPIIANYSKDIKRAKNIATRFEINNYYDNLDEMLKSKEFNTVYIASANDLHYEQCKKALKANKHVICEKPFTSNSNELRELYQIADDNNLFLFEAITTLHLPNFRRLKEDISLIGDIKSVICNFTKYSSRYDEYKAGKTPNVFTLEHYGGALVDLNVYNLHFCTGLLGIPNDYKYISNLGYNKVDTSGIALLNYDNVVCTCIAGKDAQSENFALINGENGYIKVNSETSRCLSYTISINGKETLINLQSEDNALFYEIKFFNIFINNRDDSAYSRLKEHCLKVIDLTEKLKQKV